MPSSPDSSAPHEQSSLSFTQGLLVGQLSVVLLIGAFIKFFIFGEAPTAPSRSSSYQSSTTRHGRTLSLHGLSTQASPPNSLRRKKSTNNVLRPVPTSSTNTASILRKTYYQTLPQKNSGKNHGKQQSQHSSHQPESLDWFNVLIAQTIAQYRQTAYNMKDSSPSEIPSILSTLTAVLNNPEQKPSFIGNITITEISLGEEFPIFSNCRVIALDDDNSIGPGGGSRLQALMDVDLSDDNLTLAIETSLILNYPKPYSAVLPVALSVSVVRFSGTLSISFVPAASSTTPVTSDATDFSKTNSSSSSPKTNLAFSFLPDYRLDLSVRSLVGSRSRLQDVPKIAQLVEARVQAWFEERVVEPRVQVVGLPGLWPRMHKTNVRGNDDGRPMSQGQDGVGVGNREGSRGMEGRGLGLEGMEGEGLRRRTGETTTHSRAVSSEEGPGEFRMPGAMPLEQAYA